VLDSETFGNRRFNLDGPPPQPNQRHAPAQPETLYDSSSGSVTKEDESTNSGDPGVESMAQAFALVANVENELDDLCSRLPRLLPICSDFITVLRQMVPQELANQQSMSPMSQAGAPGNTVSQLSALFSGGGGQQKPAPISGPPAMAAPPPGAGGVMG